jgi:hypothetical protein
MAYRVPMRQRVYRSLFASYQHQRNRAAHRA